MPQDLTLNEIRANALAFSTEWKGETSESAEKQSFWNDFFSVFGIHRRRYAAYEVPVKLGDGHHGRIDVFWPGVLLIEHKAAGGDLTAAFKQAVNYFDGIEEQDLPKYVIVSDFARFKVYNLDDKTEKEFPLSKFHLEIGVFGFLTGHSYRPYDETPEVNVKAARHMAALYEALLKNGYTGHPLAVLLVRLMFCLFADKTGIWQLNLFRDIIERKTRKDGSDVGARLTDIFSVLDTPKERRQKNLDPDLAELEYVNGHLFHERFDSPAFDAAARKTLLTCLAFNWSAVSPAIFGAMFQRVMEEDAGKRRQIGAHYTSEKNILKALRPLLIDDLRSQFAKAKTEKALESLLERISKIVVLDPACGCGNFLIVAYRELRQLEIDIHRRLRDLRKRANQPLLSVAFMQGLNVDAMCGIEIEEFPCRVAETALYLIDHLMNMRASEEFGENYVRLPLNKAPHIIRGNALRLDWSIAAQAQRIACIVGNPPFVGKKARSAEQSADMDVVFGDWEGHGELDYVSAWYVKALQFLRGTTVPVAFVSTNSLTQGEQVSIFWPRMIRDGMNIHFAHRTFRWDNDAPGEASVYCVIIGWSLTEPMHRFLFDYETPKSEPMQKVVKQINPYLVDFENVFVTARRKPLCKAPPITFGSMPNDGGNLLFDRNEMRALSKIEPAAKPFIRPFISCKEFIHGVPRYCLWLQDAGPSAIRNLPSVRARVEKVREYRQASSRATTRQLADSPWLFGEIRQPEESYIVVPRHSSEDRRFIPMGFASPTSIIGDSCAVVRSNDLYVLGVLQSSMHMAWVRQVCGRIKSDFRYSNEIVYNNFPWPATATERQIKAVRTATRVLLDARAGQGRQSLADLYDAVVMPKELRKAHKALDKSVDACYGRRKFDTDLSRVKYLFERYAAILAAGQKPLLPKPVARKRRRTRLISRDVKKISLNQSASTGFIETTEDAFDLNLARSALSEPGSSIPLQELKRQLGL